MEEYFDKCYRYPNRIFCRNKLFQRVRREIIHTNNIYHTIKRPLYHVLPSLKNNDPKDIEALHMESSDNVNNMWLSFLLLCIIDKWTYICYLLYKKYNSNFEVSKINSFGIFLDRDKCSGKEVDVLDHIKNVPSC